MINQEQIRAARAMLKWTSKDLAEKANLSLPTIQRMEGKKGTGSSLGKNLIAVQKALEKAGIIFIAADDNNGAGVRFKK